MSLILARLTLSLLLLLTFHLSPNAGHDAGGIYPAVPLAVRSPYLNCWLHDNENVSTSGQTWPTTFNHSQILGWSVLVRVDGLTYSFLGDVPPNLVNGTVNLNSTFFAIGPTYTQLAGNAGPMQVTLRFLNPIEPGDWIKQSIPFSYMSFTANSSDGASHHVQVYSDVSGEWNSGGRAQQVLWSPTVNDNVMIHSVGLQKQENFTEILDQAEWGTLYYAMENGANVTYQAASDVDSRGNFTHNGNLNSQQHSNINFTSDSSSVFAISRDLGTIQITQNPVVWAIGYTTDAPINYTDLSGATRTSRDPYYKIQYSNDTDMIVDFLNDFSDASSRADQVNSKTISDSGSITVALGQMLFIAIPEVYGSMQLTIGADENGNLNNSDVMMFMKNIGGAEKKVNAVETLYAAFPALMYLDPSLGAPLLEPLFRLQASHNNHIGYAASDLGANYPNVSGSNFNHSQGVEQSGNMLIMTYAYARASGDGSLISRYYSLLITWANYLEGSTLIISNQSSADGLTVSNQTNLAIKGIIAIEAMSKMSSLVGRTEDANKYASAAAQLYVQWKNLALGNDQHILATYGQSNSWTLGYNLFADVWLQTNLVDSSVYAGHSNFINNLVSNSNFSNYGMPIDSADTNVAVSSWSLFVAAMTNDQGLRSELISRVSDRSTITTFPATVFSVYYDSASGTSLQGVDSPAQGAVFAPLALNAPTKTITVGGPGTAAKTRSPHVGAIIGGTIGGVSAIFAVIGMVIFVKRRRRWRWSRPKSILSSLNDVMDFGPHLIVTPFNPNSSDAAQGSGISAEQQPFLIGNSEAEMVALQYLSSSSLPTVPPRSRPVAPVPVGLSDKEMARLRSEALNSPESPQHPFGSSTSNVSQSLSSPNAITESGEAMPRTPYDTWRLHSEVESLRREMVRLREEGLVNTAPPSYTDGER